MNSKEEIQEEKSKGKHKESKQPEIFSTKKEDNNQKFEYKVDVTNPDNNKKQGTQNRIKTTKYTPWNFIPKNLYEQFRKVANLYFLMIAVLSCIPQISPVSPITTMLPLSFVMGITAVKEAIEDWRRHQSDNEVNRKAKAQVLSNGNFVEISWELVRNGDILLLKTNEEVPADLVLLTSSDENGKVFVETSNLDGETTLKTQEANQQTLELREAQQIEEWRKNQNIFIDCEPPNSKLYSFHGRLCIDSDMYPLNSHQLLHRGSFIKDTEWASGIVTYTGHDTKIMQNATQEDYQ